nr:hypothetical protein CFP56_11392 [Quercus suber]
MENDFTWVCRWMQPLRQILPEARHNQDGHFQRKGIRMSWERAKLCVAVTHSRSRSHVRAADRRDPVSARLPSWGCRVPGMARQR